MFAYLTRALRLFQEIALGAIVYLARFPLIRRIASLSEPYLLGIILERKQRRLDPPAKQEVTCSGITIPDDPAKDIYRDIFSSERLRQGYQSQMGQDMFLNRWFFKNRGPGVFIDAAAFDGILGSNTSYFEKHLQWKGIALEPNPSAFKVLRATDPAA